MPNGWTYVVEEPRRTELLTDFGVPEAVIALGSGDSLPHEAFTFYCNKPAHVYDEESPDSGGVVVGLFESKYNESYACRKTAEGLEYIYFNVKNPAAVTVFGSSEQCLFRALFEEIVDSEFHHRDLVKVAAERVGFQFLPDTYAFVFLERDRAIRGERTRDMRAYHERRMAYVRGEVIPTKINPGV